MTLRTLRLPALVLGLALSVLMILPELLVAQDLHPTRRPSPMALARTTVGDAYVSVTYSRPYLRERDNIFGTEESGALVPFGKVWRTGANEGTQLTVTEDIQFGGEPLAAGTYTLFTLPGADAWQVLVNPKLGYNGTFMRNPESGEFENAYDAADDVLQVEAKPVALEEPVDQLTISFDSQGDETHMVLRWHLTEVRVPLAPAAE